LVNLQELLEKCLDMQNKINHVLFLWIKLMLLEEEDLVKEVQLIDKFKEH
jgi:hypothetical protein